MTVPAPDAAGPARRPPLWFLAVLVLCVVGWIACLADLAVTTANPQSLNRAQILAADVVVVGHWVNLPQGRLAVEQVWKRPTLPAEITVRELLPLSVPQSGSVLLPLTQIGKDQFRLTSGPLPNPPTSGRPGLAQESHVRPQGYPASEAIIRELEQLLHR